MIKVPAILMFVVLMILAAAMLWGQSASGAAVVAATEGEDRVGAPAKDLDRKALIAELLEISPADRRARLKSLDREQRRGLWFEIKRALWGRRGAGPRDRYEELEGIPLDLPQTTTPWSRKLAGTITYDSGFPQMGFGGGSLVGNRFSSHTGMAVTASGTISTVRAVVVPGAAQTTSSAGFVALGPQTTMGGAMAIGSTFTAASGVIDSVSFTGLGFASTGSEFFVLFGDFSSSFIPVVGTGSTMGQGHHARVGYTGGMGPNITGTFDFGGIFNSYVRASGDLLTPVELLTFDVE